MIWPEELVDLALAAARSLNRYVPPERVRATPRPAAGPAADDGPGTDFARRGDHAELLGRHGWTLVRRSGDAEQWRRPGKDDGVSATWGHCKTPDGVPLFYPFSTNAAPLEAEHAYNLFALKAYFEHGGDFAAAARDLRAKGYGGPPAQPLRMRLPEPAAAPSANGHAAPPQADDPERMFLWSSELKKRPAGDKWLWEGFISRGHVTLFSALWKAGKTTLLAHLLKEFSAGGSFLGLEVKPAKVLYVTEEDESTWAERSEELQYTDGVGWVCRPFRGRATPLDWLTFLGKLNEQVKAYGFDLVVIDTLAKLWPVREENDAGQVDEALMPLWSLCETAAVLLVHHLRKGDGAEATGSRGSGALPAFAETLVELRRFSQDKGDRRRVLTGYGRYRETPAELAIELKPEGYVACGEPTEIRRVDSAEAVYNILPTEQPGLTTRDIASEVGISKTQAVEFIQRLNIAGRAASEGTGRPGSPRRWVKASVSVPTLRDGTDTDCFAAILDLMGDGGEGGVWTVADLSRRLNLPADQIEPVLAREEAAGTVRRMDFDGPPAWVAARPE